MKKKCECCGRECESWMKFCPECGTGLNNGKGGSPTPAAVSYALVLPAVITSVFMCSYGSSVWEALIVAVIAYIIYFGAYGGAHAVVQTRYKEGKLYAIGFVVLLVLLTLAALNVLGIAPWIEDWF